MPYRKKRRLKIKNIVIFTILLLLILAAVIAGLAAHGITEISQVQHIERGYEDIVQKLDKLGADIRVVISPDEGKAAQAG